MKLLIEIPKEFEEHFNNDKFSDSFNRIIADIRSTLFDSFFAGKYEAELVDMLNTAFQKAIVIPLGGKTQWVEYRYISGIGKPIERTRIEISTERSDENESRRKTL